MSLQGVNVGESPPGGGYNVQAGGPGGAGSAQVLAGGSGSVQLSTGGAGGAVGAGSGPVPIPGHMPPPRQVVEGMQRAGGGSAGSVTANPLIESMQSGRVARNAVQDTVAFLGKPVAAMMPSGRQVVNTVASAAGAGAQALTSMASLGYKAYSEAKQRGGGFRQTIRNLPGAASDVIKKSTGTNNLAYGTVKTGGAITVDALAPKHTPTYARLALKTNLDNRPLRY